MPHTQSLPDLRRQLQEILTEDLAAALNALKDLLPEGSEKHRSVLELRARFNEANKQSFRGVITNEQLQLIYNQIRSAVFDLLAGLEEADFELKEKAASAKAMAAEGSVLYRVPHRMPVRKPTICTVRVAMDEEAILEDIVLDDEVRLRKRVEVSDMMKAELLDPEGDVFAIRQLSEPEQLVRETGYTQWLFSVTPRIEGEHQLLVKVSMMEFNANLGKYVPREVSILETITIVTESAVTDSDDTPLKATGEHFALSPDVPRSVVAPPPAGGFPRSPAPVIPPPSTIYTPRPATQPIPNPRSLIPNRGLRAVALFLAFLVTGTTATWAFTPPPTRDWWVASIKDNADAYAGYIEKYKNTDAKQYLEKAYFRKADKTEALADLREYQRKFPQGQFREQVLAKVETLEIKAVEGIRQQPEAEKIRQFVQDFPESERLPALREAVGSRAELLPVVENAYVASIQAQPSPRKVEDFLRDFPQSERLPEVAKAAAAKPEVLREVQPALDSVIVRKVENATSAAEVQAVLPALESAGSSEGVKKVEQVVAKKPQLKKVLPQVQQTAKRVKEREGQLSESLKLSESSQANEATEEAENRRATMKYSERFQDLEKRIRELGDLKDVEKRAQEMKDLKELENLIQEVKDIKELAIKNQHYEDASNLRDQELSLIHILEKIKNNRPRKSGLEMLRVQGGTFTMGSPESEKNRNDDECQHQVTVKTFEIGKYEVTQADWREVMGSDPPELYNKGCDECPVENVSWDDIQGFLKKLNSRTGKNYRLPTEAEWEYVARGGSKSKGYTYSGSNDLDKVAWYDGNYKVGNTFGVRKSTHPVGTKAPNELGIYDMSGNVWEWCQDKYGPYPGCSEPKETSSSRVLRGGAWNYDNNDSSVRGRNYYDPGSGNFSYGFRLAQDK